MPGDNITILTSLSLMLRKSFEVEDGEWQKQSPRFPNLFSVEEIEVDSFEELGEVVKTLADIPRKAVVSGKLTTGIDPGSVRRTKDNFEPQSHRWVMLDIDGVEPQSGCSPSDLSNEELVAEAVTHLPEEFQHAKCWYHLSSSMGIKPGIRVHLWYWLDRLVSDREKKAWLDEHPADQSLFISTQLHLTSDPKFIGGSDPYPDRFGLYAPEGASDTVAVPDDLADRIVTHSAKPRHRRASGTVEPQEIIRDPDTGLAIDGRERLMFDLSNEVMFELCRGAGDIPSIEDITEALWERFQQEADISIVNNREWKRSDAEDKARARHLEAETGQYSFRSRSEKTSLSPAPKPDFAGETVSPDDAKSQLEDALTGYFERLQGGEDPRLALRLTMGLGKTTRTVAKLKEYLSSQSGQLVEVYVPRHDLADEWEAELQGVTAKVVHVFPRTGGRLNPDGQTVHRPRCDRAGYVHELEKSGITVYRNACLGPEEGERCVHFETCEYLQQFREPTFDFETKGNVVRLYTHASLGIPRNEIEEEREPDLVVIDEGFLSSLVGDFPKVSAEEVRRHIKHETHRRLGSWIVDAIGDDDGEGVFTELEDNGVTKLHLSEVDLSEIAPGVDFEAESDRPPRVPSAKTYNALRALIRVLRDEWDLPARKSPARLWLDADSNGITVCRRKELRINDKTPVLLLDATADPVLLEELLPFTDFKRIDVRQNAIVVQVYDQTGSNTFWNEHEDKVEQLVEVLKSWVASGERPLLISHKPLAEKVRHTELHGVEVGHFGGIRGSNEFEDCTVVFITGRNSPPPALVEQQARAIFWDVEPPLVFEDTSDHLPLMLQGYWQSERNERPQSGVMVNVFRDPRIAAVHRQIREAETIQAIARLRLVWAEHPKYVFMLGNLPVELPVDRLRTARDMFPDKLELELLKDGHIPLTAKSLRKLKPDLCTSDDAARMMLSRSNVTDPTALDFLTPQARALATKATYRAGETRLTEHSHLFLPRSIEPLEEGGNVLVGGVVARFWDLSEIKTLLEEGWGQGNVNDLRIDGWAADGTEAGP